ncbi:MAG TPA: hypothetical protein VKT29_09325 [Terriglobales bacterium]|nr:hypothetical protein [Terriglobales bacterium]
MGGVARYLLLICLAAAPAFARQHRITWGKWLPVKWFIGPTDDKIQPMNVRVLYVDGHVKEFTTGQPRDITDQLFVVRRAYRLNDQLPQDANNVPHWKWQRGGWLLVDRSSGRVSQLKLPNFDPFYSVASWYRDYVAYCGISDDGEKVYAVVTQLGSKKAMVRQELGAASQSSVPDSECQAPVWQRNPIQVTFQPRGGKALTFNVHGGAADLATAR